MPLIDDEPPITRPRGHDTRRPSMCGSGSVSYAQLYVWLCSGYANADGMWISTLRSGGPASTTSTLTSGCSVSRLASTQPADPAPTTM